MNKFRELAKKLTPEQNRLWAIACAELVLPIFEAEYPDDDRPRLAIEAAKNKSPDADAPDYVAYAPDYVAACYHAACAADYCASFAAARAARAAEGAGAKTEEILQLGENIREQV